jgi:hypothetical protein
VSKRIHFDWTKFDSKGRNGYIGTTGINLVDLDEELFLEPITTRGVNSEACRIVLRKSAITALIEALDEIAPGPRRSLPRTRSGEQVFDHLSDSGSRRCSRGGLRARLKSLQEQPNASLHHRTAVSPAGVSASGCRGAGSRHGMP